MSTNFENSEENNRLSEVIFALLPENNIITNRAFLYAFNGNFLKASMLSRYTHCFINNGNKEITYKDKTFEEQYYCPEISVKRAKRELKEEGFITVVQKGIPAVGYITVNIEKVAGILGNFKKYQNDTTGNIDLIPLYNNKIKDNKNIKENTKRSLETEKNIPASGSPSSPKVDELRLAEEVFENRFWVLVPNKVGKEQSKQRFFQITNNCKNEKKVNEVVEGYKRYLDYLNKCKNNDFNRRPKDPSTFLNVKNKSWLDAWEFVEEEPAKKETTTQIKQPKDLERRIGIARKLKLLDSFLPDEYDREWKFIPKEVKEILVSKDVENYIKDIKTKEETLITQIACVTMIGRDGYMTWKDKYEEETGERPIYDLEFYIPFGKKLPNDIWKWLLKYSHNFGLPSERKIDEARQWYYKSDHSAAWKLFA